MAKYNAKELPDLDTYPAGTYQLTVQSAQHSSPEELLMVEVKFRIDAPMEMAGRQYTERFRLGTDDDPNAERSTTRRDLRLAGMGWAHWGNFVRVAGIANGDTESEADALNATSPTVIADMTVREGKDRETGEPSGRKFNGLNRYYEIGKREPALREASPQPSPSQPSRRPKFQPRPIPRSNEEE